MHIQASHLQFQYGRERVLEDIHFSCARGAFVCFLGASGCGKSTLLRLVANLLTPTAGSLEIASPHASPRVGFVFQSPRLCPWRTAAQNVALPRQLGSHSSPPRWNPAEALEMVGLSGADLHKLPAELSGGMQMRVSLARALMTEPEVMLLDEPFAALDEVLRQQLSELIRTLWRAHGWSSVYVTHNVSEAAFLAEKIYLLSPRPARIVDEITVPFGERTESLRSDVSFLEFVSDASQRLRRAVEGST